MLLHTSDWRIVMNDQRKLNLQLLIFNIIKTFRTSNFAAMKNNSVDDRTILNQSQCQVNLCMHNFRYEILENLLNLKIFR